MEYADWRIMEDSILDAHSLLLGMIKTRFQRDSNKMSKFIYLFIKDKLDSLLINELMVLTCLPKFLHLNDIVKVSAMLQHKIINLKDRVKLKNLK